MRSQDAILRYTSLPSCAPTVAASKKVGGTQTCASGLSFAATLLVFLAAATGTGIVPSGFFRAKVRRQAARAARRIRAGIGGLASRRNGSQFGAQSRQQARPGRMGRMLPLGFRPQLDFNGFVVPHHRLVHTTGGEGTFYDGQRFARLQVQQRRNQEGVQHLRLPGEFLQLCA